MPLILPNDPRPLLAAARSHLCTPACDFVRCPQCGAVLAEWLDGLLVVILRHAGRRRVIPALPALTCAQCEAVWLDRTVWGDAGVAS